MGGKGDMAVGTAVGAHVGAGHARVFVSGAPLPGRDVGRVARPSNVAVVLALRHLNRVLRGRR